MPDEQREAAAGPEGANGGPQEAPAKAKSKRGGADKPRRSHGERAMASLRAAKKGHREMTEPVERAQFLLAEANVLALLDVADALGSPPVDADEATAAEPAASE